MDNRCIICGEIIPEGREVCPNCEAGHTPKAENEKKNDYNLK